MREYIVSEILEGTYRTVEDALKAVVDEKEQFADNEMVRIRIEGMLHLEKTLRITPSVLPGSGHPVIVEGGGLSGGKTVTNFTKWKDNIWRAVVPDVEYTRNLYIDGKSVKRPATPYRKPHAWEVMEKEDYVLANLPGEEIKKLKIDNNRPGEQFEQIDYSGIATTHTEIADWKNIRDLEMVFEVGWVHRVIPIEWVKPLPDGRLYIKPLQPAFRTSRSVEGVQIGGCPNYIENVFELLGKPLEWYFDRTEKMLYVGFEEGDCPQNHEIVIPVIEQLMEITGDLDHPVTHLSFRNVQFCHTTWLFPQKYGVPEVQANQMKFKEIPVGLHLPKPYEADYQKVIGALRILAAKDVNFENCTFTVLGTGALQYEFGTQDCQITDNHFFEIGGSAVSLGDFYLLRAHHPEDRREIVRCIEVKNNLIHDTGKDCRGSAAIIAGYVQDVTVAHNEIHDVPYSAISMGWGWGHTDVSVGPYRPTPWKEPSVCMRNKILYNHIYRCMSVLHDGGAIYVLGCMTGTSIIGNYIHESAGYHGEGFDKIHICGYNVKQFFYDPAIKEFGKHPGNPGGIYLDEGSIGIEVCENILHDVPVPLNYHNQIDEGYLKVCFRDNILNKRPGDKGFPMELVSCAGRRKG